MIKSYFYYCNVIWLNPLSAQVEKLHTLQNTALRFILNVDNRHHRRNLYEDLKIDCLSVKVKKMPFDTDFQINTLYCSRVSLL